MLELVWNAFRIQVCTYNSLVKLEPNIEIITDMQDLELRIEHSGVYLTVLRIHSFQKF